MSRKFLCIQAFYCMDTSIYVDLQYRFLAEFRYCIKSRYHFSIFQVMNFMGKSANIETVVDLFSPLIRVWRDEYFFWAPYKLVHGFKFSYPEKTAAKRIKFSYYRTWNSNFSSNEDGKKATDEHTNNFRNNEKIFSIE